MGEIAKQLQDLSSLLGEESAEDRQERGGKIIAEIGRLYKSSEDDRHAANQESAGRKEKLRSLERELEEAKEKLSEIENDDTLSQVTQERDSLKSEVEEFHKLQRDNFISQFKKLKDHKDFEKVESKLVIPEEKDGELEFDKLSPEDIAKNQEVIHDAQDYGLFSDNGKVPTSEVEGDVPPISEGMFSRMGKKKG